MVWLLQGGNGGTQHSRPIQHLWIGTDDQDRLDRSGIDRGADHML